MNRRAALRWLALCLVAGCVEADGPAEPVWGKQACAYCVMILSDRRFGAQLVTESGDRLYFDDVGCMVLAIDERALGTPRAWVRDATAGRWLDARAARYVSPAPSPMDFGFEARADEGVSWEELRGLVQARPRRGP